MPAILISILAGVLKGQTIGALLAGLTKSQWLTLAEGVVGLLDPNADPEAGQLLGDLDPALGVVVDAIRKGADPKVAAANGQAAIDMVKQRDTDA